MDLTSFSATCKATLGLCTYSQGKSIQHASFEDQNLAVVLSSVNHELTQLSTVLTSLELVIENHQFANKGRSVSKFQNSHELLKLLDSLQNLLIKLESRIFYSSSPFRECWNRLPAEDTSISNADYSKTDWLKANIIELQKVLAQLRHILSLNYKGFRVGQVGVSTQKAETDTWKLCPDYAAAHGAVQAVRVMGTGAWFLNLPKYIAWRRGTTSERILYCRGGPNCGKSLVVSRVIDELNQIKQDTQGTSIAVAYLYFQHDNRVPIFQVIIALIKQLYYQRNEPDQTTINKHLEAMASAKTPAVKLSKSIEVLRQQVEHFHHTYIVLDALDEVMDHLRQSHLKELLESLSETRCKLLITSRLRLGNIMKEKVIKPDLEIKLSEQDVRILVKERLKKSDISAPLLEATENLVTSSLMKTAKTNMFSLVLHHLDQCMSQPVDHLDGSECVSLKEEQYKYFQKQITRMGAGEHAAIALSALGWVYNAKRTLTLREVTSAVEYELYIRHSKEIPVNFAQVILQSCIGLLSYDTHTTTRHVTYFQPSFRDLITESEGLLSLRKSSVGYWLIDYLTRKEFKDSLVFQREMNERLRYHPFYAYAAWHWGEHQLTDYPALTLMRDKQYLDWLVQIFKKDKKDSAVYRSTPFHLAAHFGLTSLLNKLISDPPQFLFKKSYLESLDIINRLQANVFHHWDCKGKTVLHIAASRGFADCAKVCLQQGLLPSDKDCFGHSAWHAIAISGNRDVAQCLFDWYSDKMKLEADIQATCREMRTPLESAVINGNSPVVAFLLEKFKHIFTKEESKSAIHLAIKGEQIDILKTFALAGQPICGNDFIEAIRVNSTQSVQFFLDTYDEIAKTCNDQGFTPLHAAARFGAAGLIEMLVEGGAVLEAKDTIGRTAMSYAVLADNRAAVRALMREGASPRVPVIVSSGKGKSAILAQTQSVEGQPRPVQSSQPQLALTYASSVGKLHILHELLLRTNAIPEDDLQPAIAAAVRGKHVDTTKLLLEVLGAKQISSEQNFWSEDGSTEKWRQFFAEMVSLAGRGMGQNPEGARALLSLLNEAREQFA